MEAYQLIDYIYDDGGRKKAGFKRIASDCLVRSLSIVTGIPYRKVYSFVARRMGKAGYPQTANADKYSYDMPDLAPIKGKRGLYRIRKTVLPSAIQNQCLEALGFKKIWTSGRKLTLTEAHERYGDCVVSTREHFMGIRDGVLRDTDDFRYVSCPDGSKRERKAITVWVLPRRSYETTTG